MRKSFVFIYDPNFIDFRNLDAFLNSNPAILNWIRPVISSAVIIVSDRDLPELNQTLHAHMGQHLYLLLETSGSLSDGWMPYNVWDFIRTTPTRWDQIFLPPQS